MEGQPDNQDLEIKTDLNDPFAGDIVEDLGLGGGEAPVEDPEDTDFEIIEEEGASKTEVEAEAESKEAGEEGEEILALRERLRQSEENARQLEAAWAKANQDRAEEEALRVDKELQTLQEDLEEAIEKGDTKTQASLQINVQKVLVRKATLEAQQGTRPSAPAPPPIPLQAQAYLRANPWIQSQSEEYQSQRAVLKEVDRAVAGAGYDQNKNEYYREMTKRFNAVYPGVLVVPEELRTVQKSTGGGKGAVDVGEPSARSPRTPPRRKLRVRFTPEDRRNMRAFGIDPDNDEAKKEYLMSKAERIRSEQGERR